MQVRSRGLLALSVTLMASSAGLAWVLEHDAIGTPTEADEEARFRGTLTPFVLPPGRDYREVRQQLDNHTYLLQPVQGGQEVLVTSPRPLTRAGTVVVSGPILWTGPHPDGTAARLVVMQAAAVESPVLFR